VCGNSNDAAVMVGNIDGPGALLLKGNGGGSFSSVSPAEDGLTVRGEVRKIIYLKEKKSMLVFLKNDNAAQVFIKE
ncbi:MAG TPA: hypothetical protein PK133_11695, partial [Ferruginibacter sp.]|nr:hypothetical protein [Ferruginibacter sp.]HQY12873.1 hypothetical protein [Ferruginibacter sp.]